MGNISATNYFALDGSESLRRTHLEINCLAFVEREQQRLGDRIGAIVLFQHFQCMFAGRIAQDDRVRFKVHRDVIHAEPVLAGLQIESQLLPYNGKILVVDGEGGLRRLLRNKATAKNKKPDKASDHKSNTSARRPDGSLFALDSGKWAFGFPHHSNSIDN